jgi:hypothetical protein
MQSALLQPISLQQNCADKVEVQSPGDRSQVGAIIFLQ